MLSFRSTDLPPSLLGIRDLWTQWKSPAGCTFSFLGAYRSSKRSVGRGFPKRASPGGLGQPFGEVEGADDRRRIEYLSARAPKKASLDMQTALHSHLTWHWAGLLF